MKQKALKTTILILCAVILAFSALVGCTDNTPAETSSTIKETTKETTKAAEQTTEPVAEETSTIPETTTEIPTGPKAPDFINPLTGLESEKDVTKKRPVAIVINNVKPAIPQIGISKADVLIELPYEGGETRLLMVVMDYESLPVVGSVRSARDYTVRLSQDFGAIFVHAGADTVGNYQLAMNAIRYGFMTSYMIKMGQANVALDVKDLWTDGVDNIDGVNDYFPTAVFYRDQERRQTMGLEHSLMTTGSGIVAGIAGKGYKTSTAEPFDYPYGFVEYGERRLPEKGAALHIMVPYSIYQFPQLIYNKSTGKYDRYQFTGDKHIDGATGEQLSFDNVILIYLDYTILPDVKDNLNVDYVGSGKGYYAYGGKYEEIRWSRADANANLILTDSDGKPLKINPGYVYLGVCTDVMYSSTQLNYYN